MFKVGLTGGIASGKTRVAEFFAARGVPVIDSDQIAREIVAPGAPALAAIRERFGEGVMAADGNLDRRVLRAIVFADPAARRDLEAITHPAIRARMAELNAQARGPYVINAIPLLTEGGGRRDLDRVLVVDCPEDLQIARVMARDQVDEAGARAVLAAQASRAARLAIADDVIVNDGDLGALEARVASLHERYLGLSQ
ncbi:MAG: dephospho-CoA kinase [Gammaproteobacteria bacterium]|jgi:dephospho-CoA kinase|nr:dephospho-CoA kinase [Gammaproteobacteria bacterium]NBR18102.1 dephospho-CoA kinase [Gammaproteobacteria bacterium]NCW57327.1 dephospho-CoA kinase [Gammaproteobacteria bacterium]NDB17385.1 dephospho-CoA kinase [Gammaproteobacteria bacterium]NDB25553.1 dephospho-CoA kinase [Gammaproteobacteria bacterium]